MNHSILTLLAGCLCGTLVVGCSGGSSSGGSTAPGATAGLSAADRDPMGYTFDTQSVSGVYVSAVATVDTDVLAASVPTREVWVISGSQASSEAGFQADVTGFAHVGTAVHAATSDPLSPGAGDVYVRSAAGWTLDLDGAQQEMVIVADRGDVYAFGGGSDSAPTAYVKREGTSTWESQPAIFPKDCIPNAAASHYGQLWVGGGPQDATGGPACLLRGSWASGLREVTLPGAGAALNVRQRITALHSLRNGLLVAVGSFDVTTGQALEGTLLLHDGRAFQVLADYVQDAPIALAYQDQTIYVGTDAGRLVYQDPATGLWRDEPGLPANSGVTALFASDASTLLIGLRGQQGAELSRRTANSLASGAGNAGTGSTGGAVSGPLDYLIDVKPLLSTACAACHSTMPTPYMLTAGLADDMADFNATVAQLDMTIPESSPLLTEAANTTPHGGGAIWATGSPESLVVMQWIADGAQFDTSALRGPGTTAPGAAPPPAGAPPPPPAPGTAVSYLADIKPILQTGGALGISCQPCHAGRAYRLSAGLADDMADYQATLAFSDLNNPANSQLLTRATQTAGHPTKHFDVGSVYYDTILKWISDGAPYEVAGAVAAPPPPPPVAPTNPKYLPDIKKVNMACIACHAERNDFELSRNLADDMRDYQTTLREVNTNDPARSSYLREATGNGHPKIFEVGSIPYQTIVNWAKTGTPYN